MQRQGKAVKGALVVDHLDGDKANNDIANLVPSCNTCNLLTRSVHGVGARAQGRSCAVGHVHGIT